MRKFDKVDEIIARLIAIAFLGFAFGVIAWGVIIAMLWIHKAVLA